MSWTDERVVLLRKLWSEGKTAAEIAGALGGVTRNAVIGKAHRLKLSNRISPIQQNNKSAPRPAANNDKPTPKIVAKPVAEAPKKPFKIKGLKMIDLKEKMCRWPSGDPKDADFIFCGHTSAEGLPYCPEHARQAYQAARNGKAMQVPNADSYGSAPDAEEAKEAVSAA